MNSPPDCLDYIQHFSAHDGQPRGEVPRPKEPFDPERWRIVDEAYSLPSLPGIVNPNCAYTNKTYSLTRVGWRSR